MKNNEEDQAEFPSRLAPENARQLSPDELAPDSAELASGPRVVFCGDIDMRIDRTGKWYFKGSIIARPAMVKLFSTVMRRDDDGDYWLITPVEMARITVEDAPFMAVELMSETDENKDETILRFRTNVGTTVTLDEDHPLRITTDSENQGVKPYITVRDQLEALLERSIVYQLIELAEEMEIDGETILGVWSSGCFFPIGSTE
ncbi:MAG: DUF1285 domain-containing protein [Rhodospirillales bacterium]|jgi:uncharacterized protein|nr:DUF1285 domain-containing protein [Rhodospirillales bacterium]